MIFGAAFWALSHHSMSAWRFLGVFHALDRGKQRKEKGKKSSMVLEWLVIGDDTTLAMSSRDHWHPVLLLYFEVLEYALMILREIPSRKIGSAIFQTISALGKIGLFSLAAQADLQNNILLVVPLSCG